MAPDQRRIRPLDLYKALTRNWYKKRPIWIMLLLNVLTEYDTKGRGTSVLDTFLIHETITQGKLVGSIESVEEQCEPLNALNNSQVIKIAQFFNQICDNATAKASSEVAS